MPEGLLRRDRAIVAAGLLGLAALAWVGVVRMAGSPAQVAMAMPEMNGGGPGLVWLVAM